MSQLRNALMKLRLALLAVVLLSAYGCGGSGGGGGSMPSNPVIVLTLFNPLNDATVGQAFSQSVVKDIIPASPPATYTYSIDTLANGATPPSMTLQMNGVLSGTPFATGKADVNGNQIANIYTFGVCATDTLSRTETTPCPQTKITVLPPTCPNGATNPPTCTTIPASSLFGTWKGTSTTTAGADTSTMTVTYAFASGGTIVYSSTGSDVYTDGTPSSAYSCLGASGTYTTSGGSITFNMLVWPGSCGNNPSPVNRQYSIAGTTLTFTGDALNYIKQ